ncbi:MAG: filamentous hemagglutinin N-terminal domain-containing protein [Nostoc sp. DedSLP03]|uniref:two-partner secretion domain-containing protein n=1 Tax=Nostoc sp. DedSLP03 TaxID=3075400 RepID=UPI002AD434E5|nr:filamentous hemagglutinin N-terminal domain-containing protein [Nostoc sp. DedSLP03]MDZ7968296.1 filamentous hemagglutinin N-terminal domain-containing protein [Nostoc sp. DedSLP03]
MAICGNRNWHSNLLGVFSIIGVLAHVIFCDENHALAQITPDRTLGDRSSTIVPNVNIKGLPFDRIDGGAIRGANLFHSFREFNVGESQRVYFANPTGINNILTRVTGGKVSNILGTLGVDGAANLFLLNSNGIIFGKNARLDIAGSFVASTANSFVFSDGMEFSATNPQAPPLLEVNLTPGLQYGKNDPLRTIENTGNLAVGQDLKLFAGNLDLQGHLQAGKDLILQADTIKVRDRFTNPFVAAAGGKLLVQGNENIDIFALNDPSSGLFSRGDMVLRSVNTVDGDAHFWSGGSFRIEKLDGSLGNLFSPHDPIIRSQGDVSFFAYQGASLHILAGGKVDINTVVITDADTAGKTINPVTTPSLANVTLSDGTAIVIDGSVKPTLDIRAGINPAAIDNPLGTIGDSGTFFDPSIFPVAPPANNSLATSADITIGDVTVNSPQGIVLLTNQYHSNPALTDGNITLTGKGVLNIGGIAAGSVEGDGGSVIFDSRGKITLANSFIDAFSGSTRAGDITLLANGDIKLDRGSGIFANALQRSANDISNALGGDVKLISGGDVSIDGANVYVVSNGGGNIMIDAQNINILESSLLSGIVGNFGTLESQAGDIQLKARENISIVGSDIINSVVKGAVGNAGKILVQANGPVSLSGDNGIFNSVGLGLNPEGGGFAVGTVGGIAVKADSLSLSGGYELVTSTQGQGDAGNMEIDVRNLTSLDGVNKKGFPSGLFATVFKSGIGNGGNINLRTGSLSIADGARIQTKSEGQGNTGNVTIEANDRIFFDGTEKNPNPAVEHLTGIFTTVQTTTPQQGGNINLKTGSLTVINGAQLTSNTFGLGNSGNITIEASGKVSLDGINNRVSNSGIFSAVGRDDLGNIGKGRGGNIEIFANSLSVTNGAALTSATQGVGDAGKITIIALEEIFLEGMGNNGFSSQIATSVEPEAVGNANDLAIVTGLLTLTNGAQLRANTAGQGKAGNIFVTANTYKASNGGQLRTTTSSNFDAGNITLKVQDNISLSGSETGLFANTTDSSIGNGGSIFIDPRTLNITDGAKIAVDSQGTGDGGSIELAAGILTLNNGSISAETRSNTGGNITLNLQDLLLLRNGSQISTTAGNRQFGGDGGNITINSPFIVAVPKENSDISAKAFTGIGGRVDITTNGIFGILSQKRPTENSDITASSELGVSGEVTINRPDTDPSRGLIQLPSNLIDASRQIAQGCTPKGGKNASSFIATGRGGLPQSPNEPLQGRAVITGWVDMPAQATAITDKSSTATITKSSDPIVEAQGWIVDGNGNIMLVAQSGQSSSIPSAISCGQ